MRRAFVIQLLDQCNQTGFAGRVEHVGSGRERRFRSREELLHSIEEMLSEAEQTEAKQEETQLEPQ